MTLITAPLYLMLMAEIIFTLSALSPVAAVRAPAISTCRLFKVGAGMYIMRTASFFLFVLCGSCVLEIQKLGARMEHNMTSKEGNKDMVSHDMEKLLVSQQGALIAGFCLLLVGVLRRLTDLTVHNASMATSAEVLKKQAKQMEKEYMRLRDESDAATATKSATTAAGGKGGGEDQEADSEVIKLKKQIARLVQAEEQVAELNESMKENNTLVELEKRRAKAEVEAIKLQSQGLEKEYDRLLEENDGMRRKLARLEGGGGDSSKKDS
mmetsp:Transcript_64871/g.204900  ORF Transcript_64871/g.204900 Transcript_64871/m.204900 type:complete len:267 (+) Transcript_64871:148-948(+)